MSKVTKPLAKDETLQALVTALQALGLGNVGNMAALVTTDK